MCIQFPGQSVCVSSSSQFYIEFGLFLFFSLLVFCKFFPPRVHSLINCVAMEGAKLEGVVSVTKITDLQKKG